MASFRRFARRVVGASVAVGGAMIGGPVGGAVGGAIGGRIAGVDPGRAAAITGAGALLAPAALAGGSSLFAGGGLSGAASVASSSLGGTQLFGSMGGPTLASLAAPLLGGGAPQMPSEGPMVYSSPTGSLTPVAAAAGPSAGVVQLSGAMPQQLGGFAMASPVMGAVPGAIAGGARMIGSAIVSGAGRILGLVTSMGTRISVPKAARLARSFGLQVTATLLGVGAVELAQAVMQDATKKRGRGRGISAREIRTTSRTIGKLNRLHARISEIARAGGGFRRRSTGRGAVHVRTAPVTHI